MKRNDHKRKTGVVELTYSTCGVLPTVAVQWLQETVSEADAGMQQRLAGKGSLGCLGFSEAGGGWRGSACDEMIACLLSIIRTMNTRSRSYSAVGVGDT